MQDKQIWSLSWGGHLEGEIATHSSVFTWKIPWAEEPGGLQSIGPWRVRHSWALCFETKVLCIPLSMASLVAQTVKCLPTVRETWVRSLSREDPLEKEMATHSSILAWRIPWTEDPGRLQSMRSERVGHDWAISHHFTSKHLLPCDSLPPFFRKFFPRRKEIRTYAYSIKRT